MTITHHPDPSTLMSYAAGSLPEPLAAVVAGHAALCSRCRQDLACLDSVGAALLEALPPAAVTARPPSRALLGSLEARLEQPTPEPPSDAASEIPKPLRRLIGTRLDSIAWRWLSIGVWHLPLPLSPGAKGDLRLLKVAPGIAIPDHGHRGAELTLMLSGSYQDEVGVFRPGDLSDLDEEVEHRPVSDPSTGCICLFATLEKARYKGLLARLMQPFTGL